MVIVLIAVALILIFTLRKNSDNSPDETIFNKIVRNDSQIDLIPKSGKYEYVFIFMHGLFGRPEIYVDTFNKKDGPIPDNFKIVLPCAENVSVSRIEGNTTSWFDLTGINNDVIKEKDMSFEDMEKSGESRQSRGAAESDQNEQRAETRRDRYEAEAVCEHPRGLRRKHQNGRDRGRPDTRGARRVFRLRRYQSHERLRHNRMLADARRQPQRIQRLPHGRTSRTVYRGEDRGPGRGGRR